MTAEATVFTTSDVARLGFVDGSTVRTWVKAGKIKPLRTTIGGHYRFAEAEVRRALNIPDDQPLADSGPVAVAS